MKYHLITMTLFAGLLACSTPKVKEFPRSANSNTEITNQQIALEEAQRENVDILAPEDFRMANKTLKEAKELKSQNEDKSNVLEEVALSRGYLERARKSSSRGMEKFQDVIAARKAAVDAQAPVLVKDEFDATDKNLKKLTARYEEGKYSKLKHQRAGFIAAYSDLELRAIKAAHLGKSRALIDEATKNGAGDLAPKTLSEAHAAYAEADSYISQNRRDEEGISARSEKVAALAASLSDVTGRARKLASKSPEERALQMKEDEEKMKSAKAQLTEEQAANAALMTSAMADAEKKKMDAVYEEARSKFGPDEAEVYKQGDKLIVRLKGISFEKNKSTLRGDNFALLKKVNDVIGSFDKSSVIVEGHTDSTGAASLNQEISNERALAVKQYLEANAGDHLSDIEAKGFGYEKPLASNKTPEGRSKNRRVDVIIEPSSI